MDAPHYFKLFASYTLPWWDFVVSPYFFARSGYAYSKLGEDPLYGKGTTYPEGRGTYRLPAIVNLDLSIQKDFNLKKAGVLTLIAEISNVFNSQQITSVGQNEGDYFQAVRSRVPPTMVTFGLKYKILTFSQ